MCICVDFNDAMPLDFTAPEPYSHPLSTSQRTRTPVSRFELFPEVSCETSHTKPKLPKHIYITEITTLVNTEAQQSNVLCLQMLKFKGKADSNQHTLPRELMGVLIPGPKTSHQRRFWEARHGRSRGQWVVKVSWEQRTCR